jgi:arabinose-5-phosphate isomerase
MSKKTTIIQEGKRVILGEAEAVAALAPRIGASFQRAVKTILATRGRAIVTGMGKSGLIGQKIAATLTSTGTPAFFLHPVEALHGDLGIVEKNGVVLLLSKSGETEELIPLIAAFKRLGVPIIGILGAPDSALGKACDIVLDASVQEEACPHDLTPTTSTTVALALGDALALALLKERKFSPQDFALLHPAGNLGKRLTLRVKDLMLSGGDLPLTPLGATMQEAVLEMTAKRGITSVVDEKQRLVGVITDGDLRRLVEKRGEAFSMPVAEVMNKVPKTITAEELAASAARLLEKHRITALIVVDRRRRPVGIIHLHDIMRAGVI